MTSTKNVILGALETSDAMHTLSTITPNVTEAQLKFALKLVFDVILRKPLPHKAFDKKGIGSVEDMEQLFSSLFMLVKRILRHKPEVIKENDVRSCLEILSFSNDCQNIFIETFLQHKNELYASQRQIQPFYLKLERLKWRVDVTISSNYQHNFSDTVIIMQMKFKNGEIKTFEMSAEKYYTFRLYVTLLIKEMDAAKKMSGLKQLSS